MSSKLLLSSVLASTFLVLGCHRKPPVTPEAAPSPPPEVDAPRPAPKKCEALDEGCKGLAGKRARVRNAPYQVEPVAGWTYAILEDATVAQLSPIGPCVAAAAFDASDAKKEKATRDAALESLAKHLGVTLPKKRPNFAKPDEKKDVHGLKVRLFQVDGAVRGDSKGPLLVFDAGPVENKTLLGVGFVPDNDATNADQAILQLIESVEATK